jgi:trimeric autotransporter adhesin
MNFNRLFCYASWTSLAGLSACGGGGITFGPPPPPLGSAPTISSISPTSATAGGAAFTLTVNGSNFLSGADLLWRNTDNPGFIGGEVTLVNSSQATLQISAADIAIPGSAQILIINPAVSPDSNTVTFAINPGPPGGAQVVSPGANGAPANGNSHDAVLSFNGRFVAFASEATNLIVPSTKFPEGYVRDTCLGVDGPPLCTPSTLLVPAVTGGTAASPVEGNALGGATPSIGFQGFTEASGGLPFAGAFIGFLSTATNLVTPNTTSQQAYVRGDCLPAISLPTCTPTTVLASVTQSGGEPSGAASAFIFANNSCHAAFVSAGTDVISGVTIPNEIYLSSCTANGPTGAFTTSASVVSASSSGVSGNQGAQQPAISSDGRFVAFASTSTNLTSTPNGGVQQIYLRDTCTFAPSGCAPVTIIVSVDSLGNALVGSSSLPAISDDGRFVVFSTQLPLPTGGNANFVSIHDTCNSSSGPVAGCAPSIATVSIAVGGGAANGPSSSTPHAVSSDGRFVVFSSSATNLIAGGNPTAQVFVRDTCKSSSGSVSGCTPNTVLISVDSKGNPTGGFNAAISDDGHFAVFENETPTFQIFFAATGF